LRFKQRCLKCGAIIPPDVHISKCTCGGLVEFVYDVTQINHFVDEKQEGIWRYWRLLPIENLAKAESIGEGITPLFRSKNLGRLFGLESLWIKDESKNPTATFKDREAGITMARFKELGISEFVICSTGNTAASFTRAVSIASSYKMHLFIPTTAKARVDFSIPDSVAAELVEGNYNHAIEHSSNFASSYHLASEGGFGNPCRIEGVKTLAFEVAEHGIEPDYYVQAIGSGVGPVAFYKGYSELVRLGVAKSIPKIVCIQPELCSPIVKAYEDGLEAFDPSYSIANPGTLVSTLANGNPAFSYPYVRSVIKESGGLVESVSEEEIVKAINLIEEEEHLSCEPAAATALAGLIKCLDEGKIEKGAVILLNHSGGVRTKVAVES